jgi:hypothetical protein
METIVKTSKTVVAATFIRKKRSKEMGHFGEIKDHLKSCQENCLRRILTKKSKEDREGQIGRAKIKIMSTDSRLRT